MQQMINTPVPFPEHLVIGMVERRVAKDLKVLTPSEVKDLSKAMLNWAMAKGSNQEADKQLAVSQLAHSIVKRASLSTAEISEFQSSLVKLQIGMSKMVGEITQIGKEIGESLLMDLSTPTGKPN